MKFFRIIPLSSSRSVHLAYPYDAPNTLVPFHLLYFLYSMPRILWPRNASPSIFFPIPEILAAALWRFYLLIASPNCLCLTMVDILYAYAHGPYLLPLSESLHSHYCKSELTNLDTLPIHLLLKHDNDTSSPTQYVHLTNLQYANSFENLPYRKFRTFIET
jgi:hypothetical protein